MRFGSLDWTGKLGALALVLAALVFVLPGPAEAAGNHHGLEQHEHHVDHHTAVPKPETGIPAHQHTHGGSHHGDCHCNSAACMSALWAMVPGHVLIALPRDRHAVPLAETALALAGVVPPPRPPRQ